MSEAQFTAAKKKKEEEEEQKRFEAYSKKNPAYMDYEKQLGEIKMQNAQLKANQGNRPGIITQTQTDYEKRAGVSPSAYEGTRDATTGQILDQYKVDPYKGEALQALKGQAFAEGDSPWAKMQLEKQKFEQAGNADAAAKSNAQGLAQAQGNLLRQGGLSSGARTRMAMQGARDLARSQQGVAREGAASRMGIQSQDLDRKQGLLSNFSNLETQAQGANQATQQGDINRKAMYDMERYKQQMQAWGAEKSADAQRAAASGGGGKK